MEKLNVLFLFGGQSSEHEVSMASARTVLSGLSADKYNVVPVYITKDGRWLLYDGPLESLLSAPLEAFGVSAVLSPDASHKALLRMVGGKVKHIPVDIAIPVLHGHNGEDGAIQGLFQMAGLPYVGCGVLASAVCMDKAVTKKLATSLGIPQAKYVAFSKDDLKNDPDDVLKTVRYKIGYPCFVKPANTGSSVGITKAHGKKELVKALELAASYDHTVLVEAAVVGREVECAVLGDTCNAQASCVGEIIAAAEFYDYEAKYHNDASKTIVPADLPEEVSETIRQYALEVFKVAGCHGLARVDFFVQEEDNTVIFNEINTMPGFTSISMYPMLWKHMGVPIDELVDRLIALGLERDREAASE